MIPARLGAALLVLGIAAAAAGQTPPSRSTAAAPLPALAAGAPVLSDDTPLQCWWRASSGAIRLGEIVDVALTCAVLESGTVTAVPDETRLAVAAVQLSPFEIVDGSRPPDVRAGDRRFFQHRYRLRILSPDVIGRDVTLPPLAIAYRLQSRVGADAILAGRDLVHQMPQLVVRVVSQVPADADDIRDSADASLAEIDALRFRANAYSVAAMIFVALGVVAVLGTLVPLITALRRPRPAAVRRMPDRVVLDHAARVLGERLEAARGAAWTPEALSAAHAAGRVVAAIATGTGVRELPLVAGAAPPEGRLLVTRRLRRQAAAVTTHVTAGHLSRALAAVPAAVSPVARIRLERLRDALAALTRAEYGAADRLDLAAVDEAVSALRDIGVEMAREKLASPREWFGRPVAPATAAPEF